MESFHIELLERIPKSKPWGKGSASGPLKRSSRGGRAGGQRGSGEGCDENADRGQLLCRKVAVRSCGHGTINGPVTIWLEQYGDLGRGSQRLGVVRI